MNTCLLCEQPDETGGYLCPGCAKATIVRLECLPDLYQALAAYLQPGRSGPAGRSGTKVYAPLPVAELPLTMRGPGGMAGVTEDWYSLIRQERGMSEPRPQGSVEARLRSAVGGLLANMPWVAMSWPLAGAFAEEIRDLVNAARSVVSPPAEAARGTRLGPCPAIDPSGVLCGAILRLPPGEKAVCCEWCGTRYPPYVWAQLKTWMDEDTRAGNVA